jgi:ISXO2-like transposase domain
LGSDSGATTNPIENYWSHLKRAVIGTYYHVSKKHISRYLAEFDYKYNTRQESDFSRFNLTLAVAKGRLKYKDLIADTK